MVNGDGTHRFERLNTQHLYLTQVAYGGNLLYDEKLSLEPNSRILDSGTGSGRQTHSIEFDQRMTFIATLLGAWLLALAKELPDSIELDGIDVSSNNFPGALPPNIHFHTGSVTNLPVEWTNQYDFIHQRLLVAALAVSEWPIALSEIFRILKPGGRVLLVEKDLPRFAMGSVDQQVKRYLEQLWAHFGLMFDCAEQLPRMLKDAGLTVISSEKRYGPTGRAWGKWGEYGKMSNSGAFKSMTSAMVKAGIVSSTVEYEQLMENLVKEWDEGDGVQFTYRIVYAQKPL